MRRDPRPVVLFLRSFRDDNLKLRTGAMGQSSLIEVLSLRRLDLFEEVLARHLSTIGPVVTLSPPGAVTDSLGAARETLTAEEWQPAILDWMQRSALIVIAGPPPEVTPGLGWELLTLTERQFWPKTVIVTPPAAGEDLRRRWQSLTQALGGLGPFATPLPLDPAAVLTLTASGSRWTVATARRCTEWSYVSALTISLNRVRRLAECP